MTEPKRSLSLPTARGEVALANGTVGSEIPRVTQVCQEILKIHFEIFQVNNDVAAAIDPDARILQKKAALKKCKLWDVLIEDCQWIDTPQNHIERNLFDGTTQLLEKLLASLKGLLEHAASGRKVDLASQAQTIDEHTRQFRNVCIRLYSSRNYECRIYVRDVKEDQSRILEEAKSEFKDFDIWKREQADFLGRIKSEIELQKGEVTRADAKLKDLLEGVRQANHKLKVAKCAKSYSDAADSHLYAMVIWLLLSIGIGVFMIAYILSTGEGAEAEAIASNAEVAILIFKKVTILSIASTLLVVFVKMFRAEAHNRIANRYRATALSTFDKFYDDKVTKSDAETKRTVLLQAMSAAFAPVDTGISGNNPAVSPVPAGDLLKLFTDNAKLAAKVQAG